MPSLTQLQSYLPLPGLVVCDHELRTLVESPLHGTCRVSFMTSPSVAQSSVGAGHRRCKALVHIMLTLRTRYALSVAPLPNKVFNDIMPASCLSTGVYVAT